jgi:hypothetical protein
MGPNTKVGAYMVGQTILEDGISGIPFWSLILVFVNQRHNTDMANFRVNYLLNQNTYDLAR